MTVINDLIWSYFRDRPQVVVGYVLLSMFFPMRALAVPYYIGKMTATLQADRIDWGNLAYLVLVVLALWGIALALQAGRGVFEAEVGPDFQMHVRNGAIERVLRTYRRNYRELEAGDINVKLFQLPYAAHYVVRSVVSRLIPAGITIVIAAFMYFGLHRALGLLFLGFVVVLALVYWWITAVMYPTYEHASQRLDRLHEDIDDFVTNIFALYITDTIGDEMRRMRAANEDVRDVQSLTYGQRMLFRAGLTFLKYAFLACMVAASIVYRSAIPVASALFVTFTIDGVLYNSAIDYMDVLTEVGDLAKMETFFDKIDSHRVAAPPDDRTALAVRRGDVVYKAVGVQHPEAAEPTLRDVDLAVPAGSRVLITGPIGGGKSTLFRLLPGLLPYTGSLTIDGHEVREMSSAELRSAITYIPQAPKLFNRSVLENITYGFGDTVGRATVESLLAELAIPGFPDLDASVGKSGSAISGGQRTVVYLIRAFLRKTPVVVLDEPTASLDADTRALIARVTDHLFSRCTLFVITHDLSVDWHHTHHCVVKDRTASLVGGRV